IRVPHSLRQRLDRSPQPHDEAACLQSSAVERIHDDTAGHACNDWPRLGQRDRQRCRFSASQRSFPELLLNMPSIDPDRTAQHLVVVEVTPAERPLECTTDGRLACAHHADEQDAIGHRRTHYRTCDGTNGGLTTVMTADLPRMSTTTSSPSLTDRSSRASP